MEVWVAVVVMSVGTLAVGRMLDFFTRMKTAERMQSQAFVDAVQQMEHFISDPPSCESVVTLNPYIKLAWVQVRQTPEPPAHPVVFRRLVRCLL